MLDRVELENQREGALDELEGMITVLQKTNRFYTDEEQKKRSELVAKVEQLDGMIADAKLIEKRRTPKEKTPKPNVLQDFNPVVGMSEPEKRAYSFRRAILASATGDWSEAGLELEASRQVAKQINKRSAGFYVPGDVQLRVTGAGSTFGDGEHLVEDRFRTDMFIERLKNKTICRMAGCRFMDNLVGTLTIPRMTGGVQTNWMAENAAVAADDASFDQLEMSPNRLSAMTIYTLDLLRQTSLSVDDIIEDDMVEDIGLAIDYAAFHGTGTGNQPKGIGAYTAAEGLNIIYASSDGGDGAALTYADIIQCETEVASDNADMGRLAYITNPKVRGQLRSTQKAAGTTGDFIWDDRMGRDTALIGYRAFASNQISDTLSQGSINNQLSALIFGNFRDLLVGLWMGIEIITDQFTQAANAAVRLIMHQWGDILIRHPESFAYIPDIATS